MSGAIITATLFLCVAAVVISVTVLRYKHFNRVLETLRELSAQGKELPPELVSVVGISSDLRKGTRLVLIAVSCLVFGYIYSQGSYVDPKDAEEMKLIMFGLSTFLGLRGLSLLGFHIFSSKV